MNGNTPRGKALPPRPSQDLGYGYTGGIAMGSQNGLRKENIDPRRMGPPEPSGRIILEGYKMDIGNNFADETPRYNPMNASRPQSSPLVNVNDPIQVHLLVETALGDSKEFEILSPEEVDDLKKHIAVLTQRIEQTRQNLTIQSKYRDAAISMAKLYSPTDKRKSSDGPDGKGNRRSIFGHNRNGSDQVKEAEHERITSEKKCEELASELWHLEKRLIEPQHRLLKHTAGILQMTHKGPKKTPRGQDGTQQSRMPGSPESMYTYSNARGSMDPIHDELLFDERSLYLPTNLMDGFGDLGSRDSLRANPRTQEQIQMISQTEQKLESLNKRLREVIVKANPDRGTNYATPPQSGSNSSEPGQHLQNHLEYLERGIDTIGQEHSQSSRGLQESEAAFSKRLQETEAEMDRRLQESEAAMETRLRESEASMEETLEQLNREVRGILLPYNAKRPEPPELTGDGLNDQLMYFQDSIGAIELELSRASTAANKSSGNADSMGQMETVMMGLWDIIQSGEEEERQRRQERRKTRSAQNLPADEDDMSPDEDSDPNEPFSLQGFSAKVQWLYSQATRLKDQKKVLQRQIKQQRELNNKSDATKDAEMVQKVEELERTKALLTRTEMDADAVREQLSDMMEKLDEARQQENLRSQARSNDESSAVRAAQEEINQRNETIAALEEELQDLKDDQSIAYAEMQGKIADTESRMDNLTKELAVATAAKASFDITVSEKDKAIAAKEEEMENMNMEIARLQTEVTIARAELDGAYGSRAQRAAEVAANPAIQKEIDDLMKKNASLSSELQSLRERGSADPQTDEKMRTLKKELEETIEEYEQMTKASIEWEKERESLESTIDKLRDERENLEAQLSDEKVRWLGMKSPGFDGGNAPPGSTSTTVLKNEFKKMMRDTRAENAKALRAEQAERRRLEDELRTLKKAQGPGKSGLSQSMGA